MLSSKSYSYWLKIDSVDDDLELLDRESISLNASTNSSSSSYKNIFTVSNTNNINIFNTCLRDLRNVRKNSVNKLPKKLLSEILFFPNAPYINIYEIVCEHGGTLL